MDGIREMERQVTAYLSLTYLIKSIARVKVNCVILFFVA